MAMGPARIPRGLRRTGTDRAGTPQDHDSVGRRWAVDSGRGVSVRQMITMMMMMMMSGGPDALGRGYPDLARVNPVIVAQILV